MNIPSRAYAYLLTRLRFPNCTSLDLEPDRHMVSSDQHVPFRHNMPCFIQLSRSLLRSHNRPIVVALGTEDKPGSITLPSADNVDVTSMDTNGFSLLLRRYVRTTIEFLDAFEQVLSLVHRACPAALPLHLAVRFSRPDSGDD